MPLIRYWWILLLPAASVAVFVGLEFVAPAEWFRADGAASRRTGAGVVVDGPRYDFGEVPAGPRLWHEFVISNRGDRRVVLNEVGCPGCGHNVMDDSVVVPPGGQWRAPVSLETAGRSGPLRRVVTITTSDPHRPRIELTLSARVVGADGERNRAASSPPREPSVLLHGPRKRD